MLRVEQDVFYEWPMHNMLTGVVPTLQTEDIPRIIAIGMGVRIARRMGRLNDGIAPQARGALQQKVGNVVEDVVLVGPEVFRDAQQPLHIGCVAETQLVLGVVYHAVHAVEKAPYSGVGADLKGDELGAGGKPVLVVVGEDASLGVRDDFFVQGDAGGGCD